MGPPDQNFVVPFPLKVEYKKDRFPSCLDFTCASEDRLLLFLNQGTP